MTGNLYGKPVEYTHLTEFNIELGKGPKGKYKVQYHLMGSLQQAITYYEGITLGKGFKKRMIMWVAGSDNRFYKKILTRTASF